MDYYAINKSINDLGLSEELIVFYYSSGDINQPSSYVNQSDSDSYTGDLIGASFVGNGVYFDKDAHLSINGLNPSAYDRYTIVMSYSGQGNIFSTKIGETGLVVSQTNGDLISSSAFPLSINNGRRISSEKCFRKNLLIIEKNKLNFNISLYNPITDTRYSQLSLSNIQDGTGINLFKSEFVDTSGAIDVFGFFIGSFLNNEINKFSKSIFEESNYYEDFYPAVYENRVTGYDYEYYTEEVLIKTINTVTGYDKSNCPQIPLIITTPLSGTKEFTTIEIDEAYPMYAECGETGQIFYKTIPPTTLFAVTGYDISLGGFVPDPNCSGIPLYGQTGIYKTTSKKRLIELTGLVEISAERIETGYNVEYNSGYAADFLPNAITLLDSVSPNETIDFIDGFSYKHTSFSEKESTRNKNSKKYTLDSAYNTSGLSLFQNGVYQHEGLNYHRVTSKLSTIDSGEYLPTEDYISYSYTNDLKDFYLFENTGVLGASSWIVTGIPNGYSIFLNGQKLASGIDYLNEVSIFNPFGEDYEILSSLQDITGDFVFRDIKLFTNSYNNIHNENHVAGNPVAINQSMVFRNGIKQSLKLKNYFETYKNSSIFSSGNFEIVGDSIYNNDNTYFE